MIPTHLARAAGALALTLPMAAAAQQAAETLLPRVVVTATRLPDPIERVPAAVTVIDRDDIESQAYQTLDEALRPVPGLRVVRSGGLGGNTSVFIRGTESDHTLVLLDGLPVNDPALTGGAFNFGDDLLGGFDRIEVLRGPGSSLYGSNAIGGVVNLIPRIGGNRPAIPFGALAGGTETTFQGLAGVRGTLDRFDYAFAVEGLTTEGFNVTPDRFLANQGEADGFANATVSAHAAYQATDRARVDGFARWRWSEVEVDGTAVDDPNNVIDNRHLAWRLGGEIDLLDALLTSRLDVGQSHFDRSNENAPDALDPTAEDDSFESRRDYFDWRNSLAAPDLGPAHDNTLLLGVEVIRDSVDIDTRSESEFGSFAQSADAEADTVGLYAQAQSRLFDRLDVTAGLRQDLPDDFEDAFTWRVGAVYDIREFGTRLRAAYGTAFKAPDLFDRFGTNTFGYVGNPDLEPERSRSWEVGFETDVTPAGTDPIVTVGATYFSTEIEDLIEFVFRPDFTSSVENVGEASIDGVEAFLTLRPAGWAEATVAYTYTDARNALTDEPLLRRPEHSVAVTAAVEPVPGLTLAPELTYVGQRFDVTYADTGEFLGANEVDEYFLVNLAASYRVTPQVELFGRLANLLDEEYEDPNAFAGRGFNVLAGLRAEF